MQLGNVALRCSSPQVTVVRFALPDLALNRTFNLSPVAVGGGPAASLPQSSQVAEFLEALEVCVSAFRALLVLLRSCSSALRHITISYIVVSEACTIGCLGCLAKNW